MFSSELFVSALETNPYSQEKLHRSEYCKSKRVDIATEYKLNLLNFYRV